MFPVQNSLNFCKSLRFLLLLRSPPASCIFQFYGGSRQLRTQSASLPRDGLLLIPVVNRLEASLVIAGRFSPLTALSPSAGVHSRPGSYRLLDQRNLSAAEFANLVTASTEECSQKLMRTTPTAGSKVSSAEILQDGSTADMPESIGESLVEQWDHLNFEKDRSNESIAGKVKEAEDYGLSEHRLEKTLEDQRHSLDYLRAQLKDQKELIRSILQDLPALKCQSKNRIEEEVNLKYSSTHEERSERIESKESVANVLTKNGDHPILKDVCVSNSHPENRFNEGGHVKLSSTREEQLDRTDFKESVASTVRKSGDVSHEADTSGKFQPPSWPEWRSFLQHLKNLNFFKEAEGCNTFSDPTSIKRAFYKFSQAHETVLESLSRKNLQILARYGCPNNDRRTVAAGKRLRNYFQIEEKSVCNHCMLQSSCESAFVKPADVHPKLSDVMRLIYSTVVNDFSCKDALPDDVKSSIIYLLQEIASKSVKNDGHRPGSETDLYSSRPCKEKGPSLDKVQIIKDQQGEIRKIKSGKVMKEEGVNTRGKIEAERGLEAVVQSEEWKCSRCSFMNLQHKDKCVECALRRSESADIILNLEQETTQKFSDDAFLLEEDMKLSKNSRTSALRRCIDERLATKHKERLEFDSCVLHQTTQEQDGRNDYFSSIARKDESNVKKFELSDGSDSYKQFDIFDDIVDAENSNAVSQSQQHSARKSSLSDLVRENMDAFSPQRGRDEEGIGYRDDFGRRGSGRFRGKGYGNEEYNLKHRYASQRGDDEEDGWGHEESPHRSVRGHYTFDSRDGRCSYDRGRGAQGKGQGARGFQGGGYNDDSYCRSDRVWRGNRSYDYRKFSEDDWEERGSRSGRQGGEGSPSESGRSRH